MSTIERARGRWPELLLRFGVESCYLVNKHGPCPICGGKDRYRFDDRHGDGDYICGQCGAGTGIILLRKLHGWDHATACAEIDKIIGADRRPPAPKRAASDLASDRARHNRTRIERVLADATDQRVVDAFLRKRQLTVTSAELRGHPACPYYDSNDHRLIGYFPAVVTPILSGEGTLVSAMQLYCAAAPEPRKKFMPTIDSLRGAAVRLHDAQNGCLGIAEGIATALAARQLFNVPVWSVLSEGNIGNFRLPPGVRRFLIFADTDLGEPIGQDAAFAFARRLKKADKDLRVEVYHPTASPEDYATRKKIDWADVVAEGRRL